MRLVQMIDLSLGQQMHAHRQGRWRSREIDLSLGQHRSVPRSQVVVMAAKLARFMSEFASGRRLRIHPRGGDELARTLAPVVRRRGGAH